MPSEKRARQRAGRQARRLEEAKRAKRRARLRNSVIVAVLAVVVVGSVLLITRHSPAAKSSTTTTTKPTTTTSTTTSTTTTSTTTTSATTTSASTTTTAPNATAAAQTAATAAATAAGCPANPSTRANTLTWSSPPAMTIDTAKTYKATVKTTAGTFVITLLAKTAPTTVNNFVFLADQGYYKCNVFHRVIPGFMDQTGDPTDLGSGTPGYKFANENVPKAYATGEVAMANSGGTDSNGAQFFILAPGGATTLDQDLASDKSTTACAKAPAKPGTGCGYSLFGKVTTGITVANKINAEGNSTSSSNGVPPKVIQRILSITISTS